MNEAQDEARREAKREYARAWNAANKDKTRAYQLEYREKNREKINAWNKVWREENKVPHAAQKAAWYRANKARAYEAARRNSLRRIYGMTVEQRAELLESQGNACAVCRADKPGGKGWHIDHCHTSGRVRGILCNHCNLMLGYARDNPTTLLAAVQYLGPPQ